MATVIVGSPVNIKVTFRGLVDGQNQIVDPLTVIFNILDSKNNVIVTDTPTKVAYGIYSYNWIPSVAGIFTSRFIGTFADGTQSYVDSEFEVESLLDTVQTPQTQTVNSLEEDQYLGFLVNPTPFYIDPEFVQQFFSQATLFEIASLIYDASREAQDIFIDQTNQQPITPTIQTTIEDYVLADVCCNLTRIYDIGNGANETSITLGDLAVTQRNLIKSGGVDRSNATTWCELAGVIRNELYYLSHQGGMKAVLKGSKYRNPMPRRDVKHQEWRSWGYHRDADWRRDWM